VWKYASADDKMYKLVFDLVKVGIQVANTEIMVTRTAIQEISMNIQDFSSAHLSIQI
jgi:hypothetical protein